MSGGRTIDVERRGPDAGMIDAGMTQAGMTEAGLMHAIPGAVFAVDTQGGLTFWNAAAERMWGGSPRIGDTDFCGTWRWPNGSALAREDGPIAACLRGAPVTEPTEVMWIGPDGSSVSHMVYPQALRAADGTITGALGLLVDISGRTSAEVDRERLAAIVSSSNDAIISKTLDGVVTSWNSGATRIFGYTAEEMIGRPITLLIPDDLLDEEVGILARLAKGERIEHFETIRVTRDGRRIDISLTVSPLRDGTGRIVGASKVARDITERRRADEVQRLLVDELNHRVKNTLATIQAIASQSLRRSPDPATFVVSFNGRVQALARAHDLLVKGKLRGADVLGLVREQVLLGSRETRVRFAGPHVLLDPRASVQLALVLHELATNARKYGALSVEGGRLAIEWALVVESTRRLALTWTESGVHGIRAPDGQGFGTTLINRSLETAGGSARLTYGPDGLVCFLDLPLPDEAATRGFDRIVSDAGPAPRSGVAGEVHGRRILLVEDEPLVAMDVESQLLAAGCIVVGPAPTVERARALIEAEAPDAALLDANLAGASVETVADALVARGVPFAFATGYGRDALPERHRGVPVLAKPFAPAQLLAVVAGLLAPGNDD